MASSLSSEDEGSFSSSEEEEIARIRKEHKKKRKEKKKKRRGGGDIDVEKVTHDIVFAAMRFPDASAPGDIPSLVSKSEQTCISKLVMHYKDAIKGIVLMPGRSYTGLGGHVQLLSPHAVLHPEISVPQQMFNITCVVPITQYFPEGMHHSEHKRYVKRELSPRIKAILESTCSSERFASLAIHYGQEKDRKPWCPHYHSAEIGIYSLDVGHRHPLFYLGIKNCGIGNALTEELRTIIRTSKMTAQEMCTDDRFIWARELSYRNVCGLLYRIFCGMKWNVDCAIDDLRALVPRHHECPKLLPITDCEAFPNMHCMYNTFGSILAEGTKDVITAVKMFMMCSDGDSSTGAALIHGDDAVSIYEMPGESVCHPTHRVKNKVFNALPLLCDELPHEELIGFNPDKPGNPRRSPSPTRGHRYTPQHHRRNTVLHPYHSEYTSLLPQNRFRYLQTGPPIIATTSYPTPAPVVYSATPTTFIPPQQPPYVTYNR